MKNQIPGRLIEATDNLKKEVEDLKFSFPVVTVYNPLDYAAGGYGEYLKRFCDNQKKTVFMGMNPGPWGMAQTGIPFGEVGYVKNWLKIEVNPSKPLNEIPNRKIEGLSCNRSEVSGKRLWGLFEERFRDPQSFFRDHFVANYCPLIFMEEGGRNRTPDKLKVTEKTKLFEYCDKHLKQMVEILEPQFLIGIGGFAYNKAKEVLGESSVKIVKILHPSPASPAANRDWKGTVTRQLTEAGVW